MSVGFMRFSACIIMHPTAYISKERGFYALLMQKELFLMPFQSKNLGKDLKISPNRDTISP